MQLRYMGSRERLDMSDPAERPGPHPEPPANLQERELPVIQVEQLWFRIHKSQHSPLYFGKSGGNRFDAPAQEYRVMYIAILNAARVLPP